MNKRNSLLRAMNILLNMKIAVYFQVAKIHENLG